MRPPPDAWANVDARLEPGGRGCAEGLLGAATTPPSRGSRPSARGTLLALALLLVAPAPAAAVTITEPVTDAARALSAAEVEAIAERLVAYREATGIQLAVVLVATTAGVPIDDYAQRLFERWGGGSAERDDGALLVLALKDRRNRLHLGYGLEAYISDGRVRGMLDDLRPQLRKDAWAEATLALIDRLWDATSAITPGAPIVPPLARHFAFAWAVMLLAFIAAPVAVAIARRPRRKRKRPPTGADARGPRVSARDAIAANLLLGPALALALLTADAVDHVLAYPVVWASCCVIAAMGAGIWRVRPIGRWFWLLLAAAVVSPLFIGAVVERFDGLSDFGTAAAMIAGILAIFSSAFIMDDSGGSSSGSTYGSSSSRSSSRSSSSSWSGGGGRSGGGGASSSW